MGWGLLLLGVLLGCSKKVPDTGGRGDSTLPADSGHVATTCGGTGALTTLLADASAGDDVLLHPDGFLVVSDPIGTGTASSPAGTALRQISFAGEVSLYADGLTRPLGNDIDAAGNIYAAEWGGEGRVFRVTPAREVSVVASGMSYASNVVAHSDGNLYVTAWGENAVHRIQPDGTDAVLLAGAPLSGPVGIVLDADGEHLLVASFQHGRIYRVALDGTAVLWAELPESGDGATADMVVVGEQVYVTSFSGGRVYRIDADGTATVVAGTGARGTDDGPALEATLDQPNGIAASADGCTLYVQQFGGALRVLSLP